MVCVRTTTNTLIKLFCWTLMFLFNISANGLSCQKGNTYFDFNLVISQLFLLPGHVDHRTIQRRDKQKSERIDRFPACCCSVILFE